MEAGPDRRYPSSHWTSYQRWTRTAMKERLEHFMGSIDNSALLKHAQSTTFKTLTMSLPFSAGQFWCCFELIADDGSFIIARLRLPKHPDHECHSNEKYFVECEVATMRFVERAPSVPVAAVYAYGDYDSAMAREIGAPFMLIEGFHGNTLYDVNWDFCELEASAQEHIISQWTAITAELATIQLPMIGSISEFTKPHGVHIGKLLHSEMGGSAAQGPFTDAMDYYVALSNAKYLSLRRRHKPRELQLAAYVYQDIVTKSSLFKRPREPPFPFNHMDMGIQNILVDESFNIIAIIDWEFAQSAPWQEYSYPPSFPNLLNTSGESDAEILQNPRHIAYRNLCLQSAARKLYRQGLADAERRMAQGGKSMAVSIADVVDTRAAKINTIRDMLENVESMEIS